MKKSMTEAVNKLWLHGYIRGLQEYAWWKDGTQYVGSCGTTLEDAVARAMDDSPFPALGLLYADYEFGGVHIIRNDDGSVTIKDLQTEQE